MHGQDQNVSTRVQSAARNSRSAGRWVRTKNIQVFEVDKIFVFLTLLSPKLVPGQAPPQAETVKIDEIRGFEQVFVPSQYIVGVGNHICRTPNALKTSEIERS